MAIWAAGISAGAGLLGGAMSSSGQSSANSANRKLAMQQMIFQERMARRAHQYEVIDLRKAGLNPVLSGTGGHGSATPSGSTARMENVKGAGVSSALNALTSISNALLNKTQADKIRAETENTTARTATEREQPGLIRSQVGLTDANAASARATAENIRMDTRLKELGQQVSVTEINKNNAFTDLLRKQGVTQDITSQLNRLNVDQAAEVLKSLRLQGEFDASQYGQILRYIDSTLNTVNKVPFLNKYAPKSSRSGRDSRDYPSYRR